MDETFAGVDDSLSPQARCVWAKSGNRAREWLPLNQHMLDSAAMAERLWDQWLAPGIRVRWGEAFPGGEIDARALFVFLAAAHDVGKASPVFVAQVETFAERARQQGLPCAVMDLLKNDRKHLPHATVSYLALEEWLRDNDIDDVLAKQLASVVGAHHGRPAAGRLSKLRARKAALGGDEWSRVRTELLDWLDAERGVSDRFRSWDGVSVPLPTLVGMCGLVIMADWLASNQDYFPLRMTDDDLSPELPSPDTCAERWDAGWGEVGMPHSWSPTVPILPASELYRSRFDGWEDRTPRPLQRDLVDLVSNNDIGLLFIESEMGSGKTEAAFVAAEILAAKWGAQGLFVALPTQATTDGMFSRMLPWLEKLPQPPEDVPAWSMTLAHGKASLNEDYAAHVTAFDDFEREIERSGGTAGVHDEEDECADRLVNAVAHQWFRGRKRRLLASFGIGTIDQLLMAGLQQKHLMLRHLAFAGKVVVIDECHSSDDFMNVYLDTVLGWLGLYGVPVILLSATLTTERKHAMLRAYAPGVDTTCESEGYPQLTWIDAARTRMSSQVVEDSSRPRSVQWEWIDEDDDHLADLLEQNLADGGCALVVRNTVKDAQRIADLLRTREIAPVTLAHSRFLAVDRAQNDAELRRLYGPRAGLGTRPERSIVVATQVVEQSLDVDFDVLITDLAPMDLLFQRVGRLHRHQWRTRPAGLADARAYLIADRAGALPTGTGGSKFVYGGHHLLRTARVLDQHGGELGIPGDIAPLVQRALGGEDLGGDEAQAAELADAAEKHSAEVRTRQANAQRYALGDWDPEDGEGDNLGHWLHLVTDSSEAYLGAMVRDAKPSLEVIVIPLEPDGSRAIVPPWMSDGGTLDTSSLPDDQLAHRIATWTVKLPPSVTIDPVRLTALITALDKGVVKGWVLPRHRLIKGQSILPMHQTHEGSNVLETTIFADTNKPIHLHYSPDRGLEEVPDELQSR
ncbi:CRISPR-associated helicase/endonuclease Cas3 [Enemella evansiae]|uniref:CRISPR-associated helicase/endonuclease Cas3 n=1 Tax=Enemella evansiae TaxID=2016499 RepID=UPI000B96CD99|nr:CRISPR-associated helicase/endonuclease Cas3 [Enemella evansiae]OYO16968.1 CRISPR-associated helicase/endonuclease Cas3 [Enemella evansiae]